MKTTLVILILLQWSTAALTELNVNIDIDYTPPPEFSPGLNEYRAASGPVNVTCTVQSDLGGDDNASYTYMWLSTCKNCPFTGSELPSVVRDAVHSGDNGTHTCVATQTGTGITGNASIEFIIVGAGIYVFNGVPNGSLPNNGIVTSELIHHLRFVCHSDSMIKSIGKFIGLNGEEITNNSHFRVVSSTLPGQLLVENGTDVLTESEQGVYTCSIPLSDNSTREINIGIYPTEFKAAPSITSLVFTPGFSSSTLTCTSTGSPATNVTWTRDGQPLTINGNMYRLTQTVTNRTGSTYDNVLTIIDELLDVVNFTYGCNVRNILGVDNYSLTELFVTISVSYDPPPDVVLGPNEYRAASGPVTVICTVIGGTGKIDYKWTSTCRNCPFKTATSRMITREALSSGDNGTHNCTVEGIGSASINFTVKGAGIHIFRGMPSGSFTNNSLVMLVDDTMETNFRLRFICRSDSMLRGVGMLIGLDGKPIATHNSNVFRISNPQPGELDVVNFVNNSNDLTVSGQGVYTCLIPLHSEEKREISIGIYPSGFKTSPQIINLTFTDGSLSSILTCTSTGSPATTVTWMRDGQPLTINESTYQLTQTVTNRAQSSYENVLTVKEELSAVVGHYYSCIISNINGNASEHLNLTALCPGMTDIEHGMVTLTGNSIGDTAAYTCNSGFELIGDETTTCRLVDTDSAAFQPAPPSCRPLCPGLVDIDNGMMTSTGNSIGDTATYTCDMGFELIGSVTTTCTRVDVNFAIFKPAPPSCRPLCPGPVEIGNGMETFTNNSIDGTATYTCDLGFELTGSAITTCTRVDANSALFQPAPPSCRPLCPGLVDIDNGMVTSIGNSIGGTATYTCDMGFELIGSVTTTCTRVDANSAVFKPAPPSCRPLCPGPVEIGNGMETFTNNSIDGTATYTCDLGFELTGSAITTCTRVDANSASFQPAPPSCRPLCPGLVGIDNGMVTSIGNSIGGTATYTCDMGFELIGSVTTTCTRVDANSAVFKPEPPSCRPLCPGPVEIGNGMETFTNNSIDGTATYTCDMGFELIGSVTTTCTRVDANSAVFKPAPPSCRPLCPGPVEIGNGMETFTNNSIDGTATYTCDMGFELIGSVTTTCTRVNVNSAVFKPAPPSCRPLCPDLIDIDNGTVAFTGNSIGDTATYTCDLGLGLIGNATSTCTGVDENSASFQPAPPSCRPLSVNITVSYTPPPGVELGPNEYRAASGPVIVTCTAEGANGTVSYKWSSTCRDCLFQTSISKEVFRTAVHSGDTGHHTCAVVDSSNISGSNSVEFNVMGAGIHVFQGIPSGSLPNNGLVSFLDQPSKNTGLYLRLFCRSDSMTGNVGTLTGLMGTTVNSGSLFNISRPQPGELRVESNQSALMVDQQGVYTCHIPLASGTETKEINIGIYRHGFNTTPQITNLVLTPGFSSSNVSCISTGSPPTTVTWRLRNGDYLTMRNGEVMSSMVTGRNYQMTQIITDRRNATYESILTIVEPFVSIENFQGHECTVNNTLGSSKLSLEVNVTILPVDSAMIMFGENYTLTCRVSGVSGAGITYQWSRPGMVVIQTVPQLTFTSIKFSDAGMYNCTATISPLTISMTGEVFVLIPRPTVMIAHDGGSNIKFYAGSVLTLTCTITLDERVAQNKALMVNSTWTGPTNEIITNTARIAITYPSSTTAPYLSTIKFQTLRKSDTGNYSCWATVSHKSIRYVQDGTSANSTTLDVQAPRVVLTLTSNTTRLPNVHSHNIFSLTCTATAPEGVVSPKTFMWWRQNAVLNNSLARIYYNETIQVINSTLDQPMSTSVLTVTETTAGDWYYLCNVTLMDLTIVTNEADLHLIRVTGPASPEPPVDLLTDRVTTDSANISWIVTAIAFTPETYVVHYGTSMDMLSNMSDPITGSSNFATMNYTFSITLTALIPNTMYFYHINSTNSNGSVKSQVANFTTETEASGFPVAAVGGGLAAVLSITVLCIIIAGSVWWLRKNGNNKVRSTSQIRSPNALDTMINVELIAVENTKVEEHDIEMTTFQDTVRKSIPVAEFGNHVSSMHMDDWGFEFEYKTISKEPLASHDTSQIPCNKERNRFVNIYPYDFSRVKLKEVEGVEGSDYINASFIDGYAKQNEYIAAQGPLPETVGDFWCMVWEYKLTTIVMLTRCKEGTKYKCQQYWPDELNQNLEPGFNLVVTLTSLLPFVEYEIRKLTVTDASNPSAPALQVTHLHYVVWPDHGVPTDSTSLINFIRRVRKVQPHSAEVPLLVHCSAGVGRTGTFIAIDIEMQRIEAEGVVDIYGCTKKLRARRVFMVQTETQYVFIHDALNELILCGETDIPAASLLIAINKLGKTVQGKQVTGFEEQFEILGQFCANASEYTFSEATHTCNLPKNRYSATVAGSYTRVQLKYTGAPGSDYINANFIGGYRQRGAYIATQGPLASTVKDFWRMIWEHQSKCIVMLCSVQEEGEESCYPYWPEKQGTTETHDKIKVTLLSEEDYGSCIIRKLEVVENNKGATDPAVSEVTQFHFLRWPKYGEPSPSASLLELVENLTRVQMGTGNRAITVMCNDGVGRTGAFICLHAQLERLKAEGVVDIFQFIKSARLSRPGLVQNVGQYVLCHKVLADFMNSFETYANFKELV